jgi:hypothetical protein
MKTRGLDGGFKNWKAQGSKRVKQDLTAISFELRVDRGLIPVRAGTF